MSLTVSPNLSTIYGSGASGSALTGRGTATGHQLALSAQNDQTNQISQTDQINITSIIVNITQETSGSGDGQLRLGVDKVNPTGRGGAVLQPYAEGYFSSPTNFVPTGTDGTTSPQTTSEASITLQILSETTTGSTQPINQQTADRANSNITASHNAAPDRSSYRSVDISI